MKKVLFVGLIVVSLVSCHTASTEVVSSDSTIVNADSVKVDSVKVVVDSLKK